MRERRGQIMKNKFYLEDLRKEKNLSQKALAKELNVTDSAISMWEKGKRTPSLKTACQIAQLFNLPVERISFSKKQK